MTTPENPAPKKRGAPKKDPSVALTKTIKARVTEAQHAEYMARGSSAWLQSALSRPRRPAKP